MAHRSRLRPAARPVALAFALALGTIANSPAAVADDVTITPATPADAVTIQDAASSPRLQVRGDGAVFLPGLAAGSPAAVPLCRDATSSPSGAVVTCAPAVGPAPLPFAHGFQLATIVNATVIGGADVPFSSNGPNQGVAHTAGTTTFTVPEAGVYSLRYRVALTAGIGAQVAIAINGVAAPSTPAPVLVAVGIVGGEALLQLAAGDVITVRNNSAIPMTLALAPAVGASLVVLKIP